MNETTNEVMETTEETMVTETPMETGFDDTVESEGGSGKAVALVLVLGGVGLAIAAGAALVKKHKDKKDGKPKKKRTHYKIVKVEEPADDDVGEENTVDSEAEVVDEKESTEE